MPDGIFSEVSGILQQTVASKAAIATGDNSHTHVNENAFVIGPARVNSLREDQENTWTPSQQLIVPCSATEAVAYDLFSIFDERIRHSVGQFF